MDGMVTEDGRDGHGRWTGWSRKLDAMVTESGQKRKIYWKKTASLYLYSFKRYQNFLLKIEVLGFYFESLHNRTRMLKNHKVKYLGVLKHAESEKHNENLPKGRI